MQICRKCQTKKPLDAFRKWKLAKSGYRNICKVCQCASEVEWRRKTNTSHLYARQWRNTNPAAYAILRCRYTAKKKNLQFDLDQHHEAIESRLKRRVCEVTGYPLVLVGPAKHNEKRPDAASIDRIDSSKGYTFDNIRIVCLAVNLSLNAWGEAAFLPILHAWSRTLASSK